MDGDKMGELTEEEIAKLYEDYDIGKVADRLHEEVRLLKEKRDQLQKEFDHLTDDHEANNRWLTKFNEVEKERNAARAALATAQDDIVKWSEFLNNRAGRLLFNGVPFFVVKASEPYAAQVVALIKAHEGPKWTEEDDIRAKAMLFGDALSKVGDDPRSRRR